MGSTVLVLARGATAAVEVPDAPPALLTNARGGSSPGDSIMPTSFMVPPDVSPSVVASSNNLAPAQPVLSISVFGAVTEPSPSAILERGGSLVDAGESTARGVDEIAPLSLSLPDYTDHGWFIVPSTGNDPGYLEASTGAPDGPVAWGFADAGYASDWFFA